MKDAAFVFWFSLFTTAKLFATSTKFTTCTCLSPTFVAVMTINNLHNMQISIKKVFLRVLFACQIIDDRRQTKVFGLKSRIPLTLQFVVNPENVLFECETLLFVWAFRVGAYSNKYVLGMSTSLNLILLHELMAG